MTENKSKNGDKPRAEIAYFRCPHGMVGSDTYFLRRTCDECRKYDLRRLIKLAQVKQK